MALDPLIEENQTDAKSPIDQLLMDSIRENLERIDDKASEALNSAGGNIAFKVNGTLSQLDLVGAPESGEKLDGAFITSQRVITKARAYIKEQGVGGNFSFDINRRKTINYGIDRIENLFTANIQQVSRASADLNTQSIERANPDLATQSIGYLEPSIGINSIVNITGTQWRVNLDGSGLLDTTIYEVGDYVELSNTTGNLNDGIFQILEVNKDNAYNLVLDIAAGTAQLSAEGDLILNAVSYNLASIAPSEAYEAGEIVTMVNHTDPSNDGDFTIFRANYSGNNIIIKKSSAVIEQGTPAGEVQTNRYKYNYLAAVNAEAFAVGENIDLSSHTDIANDGTFEIKAVNFGGSNIVVYNFGGSLQATPAGTARTFRFIYLLNLDPAGILEVGDSVDITACTDPNNNGTFDIVALNFNLTDSFVIYNTLGVDQALPAGAADKTEKVIVLYADPSAFFLAGQSKVEILGTESGTNDGTFLVKDVNRTGISQYNLVVDIAGGAAQALPAGQIISEISSIFTEDINFTVDSNLFTIILDDKLAGYVYEDGTILSLDLKEVPADSVDFSVNIK